MSQNIMFLLSYLILSVSWIEAVQHDAQLTPPKHVNKTTWKKIQKYLLPNDHPAKKKLDTIFSSSRVIRDMRTMVDAGFEPAKPQHHTQIIVTRHPQLQGYIIKAYLDYQKYHSGKPEHYYWVKRTIGAQLIAKAIKRHKYEHLLKVPKKWVYRLPDNHPSHSKHIRKNFILVEEDMNIYDDKMNEEKWKSEAVTEELLNAIYAIVTELGFFDCTKPSNCPFSKDGKVAFVDTQVYNKKKSKIKYHNLTPFLSPPMQTYWEKLYK